MFDDTNYNNWAKDNALPTQPKSAVDLFWLEYDREQLENSAGGETSALQDVWEERLDEIERITGKRPLDPSGVFDFTMSPFLEVPEDSELSVQRRQSNNIGAARDVYADRLRAFNNFIDQNKERYPDLLPVTQEEIMGNVKQRIKRAVEDADAAQETSDGWLDGLFSFAGTGAGAINTVETYATLPLGASGKTVLGVAAKEAGLAMAVEGGLEPIKRERAEFAELPDRTLGRMAADVAGAGAATFGLTAILGGAGKAISRKFAEKDIEAEVAEIQQQADKDATEFTEAINTRPIEETKIGERVTKQPYLKQSPEMRMAERINDVEVKSKPPQPKFRVKDPIETYMPQKFNPNADKPARVISNFDSDTGKYTFRLSAAPPKPNPKNFPDSPERLETARANYLRDKALHEEAKEWMRQLHNDVYNGAQATQKHVQKLEDAIEAIKEGPNAEVKLRASANEVEISPTDPFIAEPDTGVVMRTETDASGNQRRFVSLIEEKPELPRSDFNSDADYNKYNKLREEVSAQRENGKKILASKAPKDADVVLDIEALELTDEIFDGAVERGDIDLEADIFLDDGTTIKLSKILDEIDIEETATRELADCAGL